MTQVNWSDVDSNTYERMVAVLISTLNPTAERIDGAGGDGGRDIQLRRNGRLDLWELKSHTGRVGESQRRQVKRSLDRAATLNPTSWKLVIPIDPNPAEIGWFDGLRATYPFPLEWLGRMWLDSRMAEHPHLPRYFLHGGADEATQLLLQLRRDETEFAEGIPHVIERVEGWLEKLRKLDPFWNFEVSRSIQGLYTIIPIPKYRGAENDRPIHITVESRSPESEVGRQALQDLQMAIDYGRSTIVAEEFVRTVSVDAPAGLGSSYRGDIAISQASDPLPGLGVTLVVYAPDDTVVASLPLRVTDRTQGLRGTEVTGTDWSGGLTLRMRLGQDTVDLASDFRPGRLSPRQPLFFAGRRISRPARSDSAIAY